MAQNRHDSQGVCIDVQLFEGWSSEEVEENPIIFSVFRELDCAHSRQQGKVRGGRPTEPLPKHDYAVFAYATTAVIVPDQGLDVGCVVNKWLGVHNRDIAGGLGSGVKWVIYGWNSV